MYSKTFVVKLSYCQIVSSNCPGNSNCVLIVQAIQIVFRIVQVIVLICSFFSIVPLNTCSLFVYNIVYVVVNSLFGVHFFIHYSIFTWTWTIGNQSNYIIYHQLQHMAGYFVRYLYVSLTLLLFLLIFIFLWIQYILYVNSFFICHFPALFHSQMAFGIPINFTILFNTLIYLFFI